jgi:hypothetical protein
VQTGCFAAAHTHALAGSAITYNAVHGAQLITLTETTADIAFYAATDPNNALASQIDCYRITKGAGNSVSYGACTPTSGGGEEFSLLTGGPAGQGTDKLMSWK